jgi:hypothetical protein
MNLCPSGLCILAVCTLVLVFLGSLILAPFRNNMKQNREDPSRYRRRVSFIDSKLQLTVFENILSGLPDCFVQDNPCVDCPHAQLNQSVNLVWRSDSHVFIEFHHLDWFGVESTTCGSLLQLHRNSCSLDSRLMQLF